MEREYRDEHIVSSLSLVAEIPINNDMKLQQILSEAKHLHDEGQIELTQAPKTPSSQKKDFEHKVSEAWAEGVMYKGENVFEMIYRSNLDEFLEKELFEELNQNYTFSSLDGQESYLGYVPTEDQFVMGWDLWAEVQKNVPNFMMFEIRCASKGNCGPEDWRMLNIPAGTVYPNGLAALHKKYPTIIDVRLD